MFNMRGLFFVDVPAEAARLVLEKIQASPGKILTLVIDPHNPHQVHILVKDGTDFRKPLVQRMWTASDRHLAHQIFNTVLARHQAMPFCGKEFLSPRSLSEFLDSSSTLPEGNWRVGVTQDMVELLQRHGFSPRGIFSPETGDT